MAQSEGNANSAALLNSLQTNLGLGVAQITDRIDAVEKKIQSSKGSDPTAEFTARGVLTTLQVSLSIIVLEATFNTFYIYRASMIRSQLC